MAERAHQQGTELPELYWVYARRWDRLGYPALVAMLLVFYLMVFKPSNGLLALMAPLF